MTDTTYTPEEILEHRRLWFEALRSGDYTQARGSLCVIDLDTDESTYCCLGVACEVARQNGLPLDVDVKTYEDALEQSYNDATMALPGAVQQWLGLNAGNPSVVLSRDEDGYPLSTAPVTHLNDSEHWSFERLVEAFEEGGFIRQHDLLQRDE